MRRIFILIPVLFALLFITACQSHAEGTKKHTKQGKKETNHTEGESNDFPKTIESADGEVKISKRPENILPLSLDVTEIVLELVDPSKVVAVSTSVEDPMLSTHVDKAESIPNRVSSAVHIDPEEILSYDTDLMLLTKMHGQEEDANNALSTIDLPILTFQTMGTVEAFLENVEIIGEAVGESEKAQELIEQIEADIQEIQTRIPQNDNSPSVLVLSEVGPGTGPFMMGPGNISYDLIQKAGANPAVDHIGLESSTPASIEQVLKMDPDYIFLLDFVGKGEEVFEELMSNPGWESLTAVEKDRLKVVDVKYMMNPNVEVVEGLDLMVDWIYE